GSARSQGPSSVPGGVDCSGNSDGLDIETAQQYATIVANTALAGGNVTSQATALATHEYAQTARYFTEYPEDITLYGVSFNTQLGTTGVALQGEVSYRQDAPLQFDDVEVLFAALTPFEAAALAEQGIPAPPTCIAGAATLAACGQLGALAPGERLQGWGEFDVWQGQL